LSFSHVVQQDDWKLIQESISKHATVNKTSFENSILFKNAGGPKKEKKKQRKNRLYEGDLEGEQLGTG